MARKKQDREYKVILTFTDRKTGIKKNVDDMTEAERRNASMRIQLAALKAQYPDCELEICNPRAMELYGITGM